VEGFIVKRLSRADYQVLEKFVHSVLTRCQDGTLTITDAQEEIMHPLTAWDEGNEQELIPYMKTKLTEWKAKNAHRS
jgi:hypothetical protein